MTFGDTLLVQIDAVMSDIFAGWSLSTTVIATLLVFFLAYPLLTWKDPDTHPFLLARQASPSAVRQPGESAVYRCTEVPYGYPLRSGLNVKDPGAAKWSSGRNGDLRDIWTQAMRGPLMDDGSVAGPKGKLLTVLGRQKVIERSLESVTLEINVIGKFIQDAKGKRVAICLSNSVELLASIFAASFYGFHPVLIPYPSSTKIFVQYLHKVQPDILIAEAGTMEVESVLSECQSLSQVIWVTKPGNEHMNFAEAPEAVAEKAKTSTWHELVEEHKSPSSSQVPSIEKGSPSPRLSIIESSGDSSTIVQYTSENIVAAIAAMISTLPRNQRISSDDIVLPIAPLTSSYSLILTLASLFSYATVALNSVAGESVDFALAASIISPTIILASSQTTLKFHDRLMKTHQGPLSQLSHYWQNKSLLKGNMPKTPLLAPPERVDPFSKFRLLLTYHHANDRHSPRLSPTVLKDLRILLGARICYALTAPGVAGAVCQTNPLDYRLTEGRESHFGPPLSCVEILLAGEDDEMLGNLEPRGKIVVRGPAVIGGEIQLDLVGQIGVDHTLSLV